MILTVTLNPSVDISYPLETFQLDAVNRSKQMRKTAGGKGLNVTRVAKLMDATVLATGMIGGTVGDFIEKALTKVSIDHDFLKTEHESRNCIAILHGGKQTEILEAGPVLSQKEEEAFLRKFETLVSGKKVVVISGSLPQGISLSSYQQMIEIGKRYGVRTLLDCSEQTLKEVVSSTEKPYLIKPNQTELSQLLEKEVSLNPVELKGALEEELFSGIEWIVVSLGANGAFIKVRDQFYLATVPKINAINPVGSGDATMAGLAMGLAEEKTIEETIRMAMTAGVLNALESETGSINLANFDTYFEKVKVDQI